MKNTFTSRILAIDTAQLVSGYAVLDILDTTEVDDDFNYVTTLKIRLMSCGSFETSLQTPQDNLIGVERSVLNLCELHRPTRSCVEVEMPKFQTSTLWRRRTDGVVILALAKHGLHPSEHVASEIPAFWIGSKQVYSGGKSSSKRMQRKEIKPATQEIVKNVFNIPVVDFDASDAVAIGCNEALCHKCFYRTNCPVRTKGIKFLIENGCKKYEKIELVA